MPPTERYRAESVRASAECADHREGGEVDAARLEAGAGDGGQDRLDHLAPGGDDDDAQARAGSGLDEPDRLVVEDRGLQRHRQLVGCDVAHGCVDLDLVGERRDVDGAHDDLRVGDADAHLLPEALVLGPQLAQRRADGVDVDDLAIADDAEREGDAGRALEAHDAVDGHLGGDCAARLDVQADDRTSFGSFGKERVMVRIEALIGAWA